MGHKVCVVARSLKDKGRQCFVCVKMAAGTCLLLYVASAIASCKVQCICIHVLDYMK